MNNSVCDIISAISSAIGAISIPITILISLKPYKRKVSFQPTVFDVHFSEERDISHIDLKITNSGERKFVYQSWGVADKRKIQLYELDKNMVSLEEDDSISHNIPQLTFQKALEDMCGKHFRFYLIDNRCNKYFSKKYRKSEFRQTGMLNKFFS